MNLKATYLCIFLLSCSIFALGQNYLMNANTTYIVDCDGFFLDSGGGNGNYGSLQNFTTTICPDTNVGTHVKLVFSNTQLAWGDDLCFFDGTTVAAPSLGCASDFIGSGVYIIQATANNPTGCVTLRFKSDLFFNGPGWSAKINCVAKCQIFDAVMVSTSPAAFPLDTGWIDICPGEEVSFSGAGQYPENDHFYHQSDQSSKFVWDFGDGVSATGKTASHVFSAPGGYVVELTVTDTMGCKNTNYLSQRIRVAGKPTFMIGDHVSQVCVNDTLHLQAIVDSLDADFAVSVLPTEEAFPNSGIKSDSLPLPDGNGASYLSTLSFSGFSPGQTLTNITDLLGIWVTMEHSWMRDLQIRITCPNGQNVLLHDHPGQVGGEVYLGIPNVTDENLSMPIPGTGYEYGWQANPQHNYTWIEYANLFFPQILPAGSYKSYQPLTGLIGCPLNGDWTIEVTDKWPIDNGYIFSWMIEFNPDLYPNLETFTPALTNWNWNLNPTTILTTGDAMSASSPVAGNAAYTFTVTDEFGCNWDTTVQVKILPFNHPDCYNCQDILAPLPDTSVCPGEPIALNAFSPVTGDTTIQFLSHLDYAIGAGNHPPAKPYFAGIDVISINPGNIVNAANDIVSVCVDLETDTDGDIELFLVSPNNVTMMLSTNNGGNGDNYTNTCFTSTALVPITAGTAPFTGSYRPEGNWNVFNGAPINGTWKLRLADAFSTDKYGKLKGWSITFNTKNQVTYSWTPATGLSCTNCPNPTLTPNQAGNWVVQAQDVYGCVSKDTIIVAMQAPYPAPVVTCQQVAGGQVVVNWQQIEPGLTYQININGTGWQAPNNGTLSHLVTGLLFGADVNIQVRVAINGACPAAIANSFCEYSLCDIVATAGAPGPYAVSCFGVCDESLPINVTMGVAPYTFIISNLSTGNTTTQNNALLNNLCAGNYQVIVEDVNQCRDTVTFMVGSPAEIVVAAVQDSPVTCNGGNDGCASVTANGGAGNIGFVWNNPNMSTTQSICTLPAGPIVVTATDANGCKATDTVTITQPAPISLTTSKTDVLCFNGNTGTATISATGGVGNFSYQWSGGNSPTQATTGGLTQGNYSVTVMDGNGCQAFSTVSVSAPSVPLAVQATQTVVSCFGELKSEAVANATGGTGNLTYHWSPSNQTSKTATNLSPTNYTVQVTDANGCTATATIAIVEREPVTITLTTSPPSCNGASDGEMAANIVTGGNGVYSYKWNTGATTDFIANLQGGQTYTLTVTDSQGCTGVKSRTLENPPAISLTINAVDTKCFGSADGVASVTNVANAIGAVTYQWDANAQGQTTAQATDLAAGTYGVTVTDGNGCTASSTATLQQPTALQATFQAAHNKCFGDSNGALDVKASGGSPGFTYLWSNGSNSPKIASLPVGFYTVTITDTNGCTLVDSASVLQPEPVDATLTVKDVSCFGKKDGAIKVNAVGGSPPFMYAVNNGQFFGSSTLIALKAGDYTVSIRDVNGCVFNTSATVNEPLPITLDILSNSLDTSELMISLGESVEFEPLVSNSIGMVTYTWTTSYCGTLFCDTLSDCNGEILCEMPVAEPMYTNDYYLLVVDENGCRAEDHVQIHVKKERRVMVPSGFSPNADGLNDLLTVHGKSGTMIKVFRIFDRWGEMLYEHFDFPINDTTTGWDGTFKGQTMMPGVYVWYLEAEYEDGMKENFRGGTTLIR